MEKAHRAAEYRRAIEQQVEEKRKRKLEEDLKAKLEEEVRKLDIGLLGGDTDIQYPRIILQMHNESGLKMLSFQGCRAEAQ